MMELIEKIDSMTDYELQDVMDAVRKRYAAAYPQWDIIYLAIHKDPAIRRQEYTQILEMIEKYM